MKPLYMWAGGKNKMIPKYQNDPGIPYSGYDTFVEPFFGGGAMMIHVASKNPHIKKFVLNDINAEIVNLYKAIKLDARSFINECDILCDQYIPMAKVDRKKFFYEIREKYITESEYSTWTAVKEAAVLYFLMKTAFNGIFQSTKAAKGRFATPCGLLNQKEHVYDKANVLEWNVFLQKVDIYSGDWKDCTKKIKGKAFYFMDPPYRNSFTQYNQDFTDEKQLEVIDFCKAADLKGNLVMLCNRDMDDDFFTSNQGQLNLNYYDVKYTAGRRATEDDGSRTAKDAKEVLLFSSALYGVFEKT